MGTANKVPGVSGGVVALALNFYDELLNSMKNINIKNLLSFKFKDAFKNSNKSLLLYICLGIIISYFSTSKLLDFLLNKYELLVWSVFFGLVIGTIIHLKQKINSWNNKSISLIILGIITGLIISYLDPMTENTNLLFVFICGILSICGMIIPGLSGSFLLILLGNYVLLLVDSVNVLFDSISSIISGDLEFLQNSYITSRLKIIAVFTLGSVTGLVLLSKVMSLLLNRFNNSIQSIIFGLFHPNHSKVRTSKGTEGLYKYGVFSSSSSSSSFSLYFFRFAGRSLRWSLASLVARFAGRLVYCSSL